MIHRSQCPACKQQWLDMQRDGKLSPQWQGRAVNRDQDKMTQMLHVTNRQSSFYKEVPRMTGKSGLNKEQTGKSQQRISNDKKKKKGSRQKSQSCKYVNKGKLHWTGKMTENLKIDQQGLSGLKQRRKWLQKNRYRLRPTGQYREN